VDFTEAIAILVTGILPLGVIDALARVPPIGKAAVAIVLIGIDGGAERNRRADQRGDRGLLNVREHPDHDGAAALDHADHRRLVFLQGAAPPLALKPSAPSPAPLALNGFWMALVAGNNIHLITLDLPLEQVGALFCRPPRAGPWS